MNLPINLPPIELKLRTENGILKVFDPIRAKYVALTPEEYVRQHFTAWMRSHLGFPASSLSNEVAIELNGTRRRCDTVAFSPQGKPLVIVEYKAPDVPITQKVFDQIVRYDMVLQAQYLVVSNGMNHYCCRIDYANHTYHFIPSLPHYDSLINPICHN